LPWKRTWPQRKGVDRFYDAIGGRKVDALLANARKGLAKAFSTKNSMT
jgi:hypothetical protein